MLYIAYVIILYLCNIFIEGNHYISQSVLQNRPTMSLLSHFTRRIRLMGPISIGEFMKDVISDPQHGYYPQVENR